MRAVACSGVRPSPHRGVEARLALRRTRLPGGKQGDVWCVSERDVGFLFHEVGESEATCSYLRHGVTIARGSTVVDVGANIGLFTRLARRLAGPSGRGLALEPIEETFACLARNVSEDDGPELAPAVTQKVGLSDARGTAEFHFYPAGAGWSGVVGEGDGEEGDWSSRVNVTSTAAYVVNVLDTPLVASRALGRATAAVGRALKWALPAWAFRRAVGLAVGRMAASGTRVTCELTTLSLALAEAGMDDGAPIDLLKVDVEGHELRVLQGISALDFARIQQAALEVQTEANVAAVTDLLTSHGLQVVSGQDPALVGTPFYTVHARRQGLSRPLLSPVS